MNKLNQYRFSQLSKQKQQELILALQKTIESDWDNGTSAIALHQHYLKFYCESFPKSPLSKFSGKDFSQFTQGELVDCFVQVERAFRNALREEEFLITSQDKPVPTKVKPLPLVLILENIRSAFNVGACLRAAECLSIEEVITVGYTPEASDPKVAKTALNCQNFLQSTHFQTLEEACQHVISQGYRIAAFETVDDAKNLYEYDFNEGKWAFLIGNEQYGLSYEALSTANQVIKIPVYGQKNSLNCAMAFAVAGYEFSRQSSFRTPKKHIK